MALDISTASGVANPWQASGWLPSSRALQSGDWVALREPIGPLGHDEALLLCRQAGDWVVWIPDHGEATVAPSQFA